MRVYESLQMIGINSALELISKKIILHKYAH
jgi:hypothetical protein